MKGFALIEVLVALFILSLGLFGIAAVQLSALQYSQDAYWQSLATTQLSSLSERFRANQSTFARDNELILWNATNAYLLPQGRGDYHCLENLCTLSVGWTARQMHTLFLTVHL